MEELGEIFFFNGKQTDKIYKVVGIYDNSYNFCNFTVQECYLELLTVTQVAIDPDNSKEYKYVEVYEKKPFGRKKQMHYKLFHQLITHNDFSQPIMLKMTDQFCYKDII